VIGLNKEARFELGRIQGVQGITDFTDYIIKQQFDRIAQQKLTKSQAEDKQTIEQTHQLAQQHNGPATKQMTHEFFNANGDIKVAKVHELQQRLNAEQTGQEELSKLIQQQIEEHQQRLKESEQTLIELSKQQEEKQTAVEQTTKTPDDTTPETQQTLQTELETLQKKHTQAQKTHTELITQTQTQIEQHQEKQTQHQENAKALKEAAQRLTPILERKTEFDTQALTENVVGLTNFSIPIAMKDLSPEDAIHAYLQSWKTFKHQQLKTYQQQFTTPEETALLDNLIQQFEQREFLVAPGTRQEPPN